MKNKISFRSESAELLGNCIFTDSKLDADNAYFEFISVDIAKKVWLEIKKEWREKNYFNTGGLIAYISIKLHQNKKYIVNY